MLPVVHNISVYKGDTFIMNVRLRARKAAGDPGDYVDLTGVTVLGEVVPPNGGPVLATFVSALGDQTTTDGKGRLQLQISAAETAALPIEGGKYDVQVTFPDGTVRTYLRGVVEVQADVTS